MMGQGKDGAYVAVVPCERNLRHWCSRSQCIDPLLIWRIGHFLF